jgi:hypothetical protein
MISWVLIVLFQLYIWSDSYGCNIISDNDNDCYGNDDINNSYKVITTDDGGEVRQ